MHWPRFRRSLCRWRSAELDGLIVAPGLKQTGRVMQAWGEIVVNYARARLLRKDNISRVKRAVHPRCVTRIDLGA